jgi:hypothetical protein
MRKSLSTIYQTIAALMSLFVAMLIYPDIQKKAQDELDSLTDRERLPTFEDRPRLPFVDAVCKETLRWRPVTPLGAFHNNFSGFLSGIACLTSSLEAIPHATTKDDIYAGFFIPRGWPRFLNNKSIGCSPTRALQARW